MKMDIIKCENCGEKAMDEEEQVCKSCGFVIDDWKFETEGFSIQPSDIKDKWKSSTHNDFGPSRLHLKNNKQSKSSLRSPGFSYGMDVLKNLCHVYNICKGDQTIVESLFRGIYLARHYVHRNAIGTMAGCCVNYVLNKNNTPVSLIDLCSKLKCDKRTFSRNKKYFDSWYKNRPDGNPTDALLSSPDKKHKDGEFSLPSTAESHIYSIFSNLSGKDRLPLIEKTKQLVKLTNACWLYAGRNPYIIVVACAFLCWKSTNLGHKKTTFQVFHSELSISGPNKGYSVRIAEITNVLLKLGCKIPSYSNNNVTKKNVLYYLDYILENFETLCNDLFKEIKSQEALDQEKYAMFRIKPLSSIKEESTASTMSIREYDSDKEDEPLDDSEISNYLLSTKQKTVIDAISALK